MGIEIERRFLVENEDWKDQVIRSESFSQAYLNSSVDEWATRVRICLLYTSPSPRDRTRSRMPSSA